MAGVLAVRETSESLVTTSGVHGLDISGDVDESATSAGNPMTKMTEGETPQQRAVWRMLLDDFKGADTYDKKVAQADAWAVYITGVEAERDRLSDTADTLRSRIAELERERDGVRERFEYAHRQRMKLLDKYLNEKVDRERAAVAANAVAEFDAKLEASAAADMEMDRDMLRAYADDLVVERDEAAARIAILEARNAELEAALRRRINTQYGVCGCGACQELHQLLDTP